MSDLKALYIAMDKHRIALSKIFTAIEEANKRKMVRCLGFGYGKFKGCGKLTRISSLVYIQTHWYESPSGCTDGDLWHRDEGQFVCPKCGALNRLRSRPEVVALKPHFMRVEDTYDND